MLLEQGGMMGGERDVNISAQDQREHLERDTAQPLLDQLRRGQKEADQVTQTAYKLLP